MTIGRKGGIYFSANKEGVAESIHVIFNGEEMKYMVEWIPVQ